MSNIINKWGIAKVYAAQSDETAVHPEDLDTIKGFCDISVFHCIDEDLDYITIQFKSLDRIVEIIRKIRIKPIYFIIKTMIIIIILI